MTISDVQNKSYAITTASNQKTQLIWVSVNSYDNDPAHFWKTFVTTLAHWDVQFSQLQRHRDFPQEKSDSFFSALSGCVKEHSLTILFHGMQEITNPKINQFLQYIMNLEPSHLFLILVHNHDNNGQTSKSSESNKQQHSRYLTESEESARYSDFSLSKKQLTQIRSVTDGWRGAVDMIVALLNRHGTIITENLDFYVQSWLETEFYGMYTRPEIVRLVQFSLLDYFPLALVSYLAEWNGEALMDVLIQNPIIRFDEKTQLYFFSSALLPHVQQRQLMLTGEEKKEFYLRVGKWYQERGDKVEAIHNYKRAGDYKKVIQVMKQWTFPNTREVANCYVKTIGEMPTAILDKNPILYVILGHMLSTLYRYQEAHDVLEKFCRERDKGNRTPPSMQTILGEAYTAWANAAQCLLQDEEKRLNLYIRASELLPNGSGMVKSKMNRFSDCPVLCLHSPQKGSLHKYLDYLKRVEPYIISASKGSWAGCYFLAMAEYHYYTRNFKDVEFYAKKAIDKALSNEQYDMVCSACYLMMRVNVAKGNYKKTMESLDLLRQYASEANYDTFFTMPDIAESWYYIKLGKKHRIPGWLKDESACQRKITPWNYGRDRLVHAYYLISCQEYESVLAYADASIDLFKKRGYYLLNIYLLVMKAVAYHALGNKEKSVAMMEEAYYWTHENDIIMPLIEFGKHIRPLAANCKESSGCTIPHEWLDRIEKKATSYYVYQHNIRKQYEQKKAESTLLENLTRAEQNLLLLISQGMTAKSIAEMQGKSLSTIKGMARRVYAKIGASGMADAIRIATEYNIEKLTQ